MKNKGFTLVELSIALVIVGLLIGGILVGQSLLEASRVNAQIKQFQQLDIAIKNFQNKFKGLPGDNKTFQLSIGVNPGPTGNGDGIINGEADLTTSFCHDQHEFTNFWFQMSYTKMLPNTSYPIMWGSNTRISGTTVPKSFTDSTGRNETAPQKNIGILAYGIPTLGKNYYSLLRDDVWCNNISRSVNGYVLMLLDKKMDDGIGNTGQVVARSSSGVTFEDAGVQGNGNCLDSTGAYRTTGTYLNNFNCLPRIQIFSQIGE